MPEPQKPAKAVLQEIAWDDQGQITSEGKTVPVQFNPETLKVSYANQTAGGSQVGGSAIQFVGQGTTTLNLDLWFDVDAPEPDAPAAQDVRELTKQVALFMMPKPGKAGKRGTSRGQPKLIPPGARFLWGSFLFEGIMLSMNENLEFFSAEGVPLRASVAVSLTRQEIQIQPGNAALPGTGGDVMPGTVPQAVAQAGDSIHRVAARSGRAGDWQELANELDIENPRHLPPGFRFGVR